MMKKKAYTLALLMLCALIFLVMLYCNLHTDIIVDDFAYLFDFSDGIDLSAPPAEAFPGEGAARISSLAQIFPSMAAHRLTTNGRVFAHFFVQLFLMLPGVIFKLLNSGVFVLQLFLLISCAYALVPREELRREEKLLTLLFAFACIWLFQPSFGQVNLWLDGAINYLWCAVISLIFIRGYIRLLREGELAPGRAGRIGFILFSFIVGAYCENSGGAMIVFAICILFAIRVIKGARIAPTAYASLAAAILGFIFLFSAPAEAANKMPDSFSIYRMLAILDELLTQMHEFIPLTAAAVVLLTLGACARVDADALILSASLFVAAMAAAFCLALASYVEPRSLFFTVVLLTLCCMVMLAALSKSRRALVLSIMLVALLFMPRQLLRGIDSVRETYEYTQGCHASMASAARDGVTEVELPYLDGSALSKYSPLHRLSFVSTDAEDFPNRFMARYYGLDSVRAK